MLAGWGRRVYEWRKATLIVSAIVLVLSVVVLLGGGRMTVAAIPDTEADVALQAIERELHQPGGSSFMIVTNSRSLHVDDAAYRDAFEQILRPLRSDRRVLSIQTPYESPTPIAVTLRSADNRRAVAQISFRDDFKTAANYFPDLRRQLRSNQLELTITGTLAFKQDLDRVLAEDLLRGELLSTPLSFVVLLLVFGTVVAAMLPVGVGGLAVVGGMAGVMLLSRRMDVTQYCLNVVSLIGLGVAIDYSLFIVNRFREELEDGTEVPDALANTMRTAGRAVAFSGFAVVIGLGGLLFYKGTYLAAMGVAGMMVVTLAVVYALTFLPALLGILGRRVNAGKVPFGAVKTQTGEGFWHRVSHAVMARPVLVLLPTLAFLLAAGVPFLRLRAASSDVTVLPLRAEARAGFEILREHFPALSENRVVVVVRFPSAPVLTPERLGALYDFSRRSARIPGVSRVQSVVDLDPTITREGYQSVFSMPTFLRPMGADEIAAQTVGERIAVLAMTTPHGASTEEARAVVRALRADRHVGDGRVYVSGQTALDLDTMDYIAQHTPRAVAFVMGMTMLVLFALLGSVVLPIKAVLLNLLSLSASFGALVWIFQDGHLRTVLRFNPTPVEPALPVVLFCAVFGLSMDYEVLMLTRMQEEFEKHQDNTRAVAEGLERSGRLITSAAAIMVAVFSAFALAEVVILKAFGLGMAIAVAIDATIVRTLLVPSTMRLFGSWNWWAPEPLAKLHRRFGFTVRE